MKLINSLSSLCVAGLTVFATGCSSNDDEPGKINRDLPFGRYSIKGNVSAADSGEPLRAEMRIALPDNPSDVKSLQIQRSEMDGTYLFSDDTNVYEALKVVCIPEDRTYAPDSVVVTLKYEGDCYLPGITNPLDRGRAFHEVNFQLKNRKN